MSLDWAEYSSYEDEMLYSRYFNMEEEMQLAEAERASLAASMKTPSYDEMGGLQKTEALHGQMRAKEERDTSLLPTQMMLNVEFQEENGSQAAASQAREETLQKEMEYEKTQKQMYNDSSNSEDSLKNNLLNESQQRENLLLKEIACLKEEVAKEVNLRQKADDERGTALVNLKLEMFSQAAAAKTKEEALQKQFDDHKKLWEAERDDFTKSQISLKERFEEERKTMGQEICRLKEEVANESKLRQRTEDERGMILVKLKLEMASQISMAKARENALLKEMDDLKSCQEFQSKLFNTQLNQLLQEHGSVKSGLHGEIATLKEVHTIEINQQSEKIKALQEEMEKTKVALKNSEKEMASFTKDTFELKTQIMDKAAEIDALKNEVSQRTDSLQKVTVAVGQKSQEWDMEKQTLLKQIDEFKSALQKTEAECKSEKRTLLKQIDDLKGTLQKTEAECKSEKQTLLKQIDDLKGTLQKTEAECKSEKRTLLKQIDDLTGTLQKNETDNQALAEKSAKLEVELAKVGNEIIELECHLNKEAEQKSRMVEQIQLLKKLIEEIKEKAVQASINWEVEKTSLMKNFESKFHEKELEKQTLMKKIEQVEHEAVQQKAFHKQAMSELQGEKTCMLKETQDLKTALKRNGDETKQLQDMVRALDQELEKKRRRWFKRLFHH